MNFSEKIQKLRKQNNLTQEDFAQKLYISRTAVSKWESGKGYPSIDVLKQISQLFNVSIDSLLSSDEILELAEQDKAKKLKRNNGLIFAIIDLLTIFIMFLPLYGVNIDDKIYSISLLNNNQLTTYIKTLNIIGDVALIILGIVELILSIYNKEKGINYANAISLIFDLVVILFLMIIREPYACCLLFILFMFKIMLLLVNKKDKCEKK